MAKGFARKHAKAPVALSVQGANSWVLKLADIVAMFAVIVGVEPMMAAINAAIAKLKNTKGLPVISATKAATLLKAHTLSWGDCPGADDASMKKDKEAFSFMIEAVASSGKAEWRFLNVATLYGFAEILQGFKTSVWNLCGKYQQPELESPRGVSNAQRLEASAAKISELEERVAADEKRAQQRAALYAAMETATPAQRDDLIKRLRAIG